MAINVIFGIAALAALIWVLFPNIQRIARKAAPEDARPLHERYPQILTWKKGDRFENSEFWAGKAEMLSITADGRVFLKDYERTYNWSVEDVVNHVPNMDAQQRRVTSQLKNSTEYMTLLSEFQRAVEELKRRDVKTVGQPIQDLLDKAARS